MCCLHYKTTSARNENMFWLFEMWLEFPMFSIFRNWFPLDRSFKNFPTSRRAMRLKAFVCSSATLNKTESAQTRMQSQAHPWRLAATWKQSTLIASRLARNVKAGITSTRSSLEHVPPDCVSTTRVVLIVKTFFRKLSIVYANLMKLQIILHFH